MNVLNVSFNELCLQDCEQQTDKQIAQSQMESFVAVLIAFDGWLRETNGRYWESLLLRSSVPFYDTELRLAEGHSLQNSIEQLDQTKRAFFLSLATRTPLYDHSTEHQDAGFDILLDGKSAAGLSAAHALRGVALSFPTADKWDTNSITACLQQINEQGELSEEQVKIHHASLEKHVEELKETLQQIALPTPQTGKELSPRLQSFFPFLCWSKDSEQALSQMGGGRLFAQVFERLQHLNNYAKDRQEGYFDIRNKLLGNASDESDTVKKDSQLSSQRRFSDPEGNAHECFWHLKLGSGRRIHFFPLPERKEIFVGYIGKHLPL